MILKYLALFPLFIFSSCSLVQEESDVAEDYLLRKKIINNPASNITIDSRSRQGSEQIQTEIEYGLEIVWDIPEENIDGYVIYSGQSPDNLDSELHVRISDLKVIDDKEYSYTISPVDPDKPIYVAIAAKIGDSLSEKSAAKEYLPDAKFSEYHED